MGDTQQTIRNKREARATLVAQAQALLDGPNADTPEIAAKFDAIMADVDTAKEAIDRMERLLNEQADLKKTIELRAGKEDISPGHAEKNMFDESKVFGAFLRLGYANLNAQSREAMNKHKYTELASLLNDAGLGIYAAQGVGTGSAGGFTVPDDSSFMARIESAMLAFGGMREAAFVFNTATGASLPMPTDNDTSQEGELLGEGATSAEQDVALGQVTLGAYKYSTKRIKASMELIQDSAFPFENYLADKLGTRRARITNRHFTVGTGSGQPNGVVTASAAGKVGTTGQATTVIYDDLIDLLHSVDPSYRFNARWMFHDNSLAAIRKLTDSQNRPLWQPGLLVDAPDTILGHPYTINQHMAPMAANARSILFGDFSKYFIRNVASLVIARLSELYMESAEIGFVGFSREDGNLIDAGTNPIKYYANSAT